MITDNFLTLSGAVSAAGVVTGQLLTANSTLSANTIDLGPLSIGGNQAADEGNGEPLSIVFDILVAPTVCTDLTFQLIQADDAALTSNVQVLGQTGAFTIAQLPAGTLVPLRYPRASPLAPKRYVGVRYVATGGIIATASVFASVVKTVQDVKNLYFKSGFSVT